MCTDVDPGGSQERVARLGIKVGHCRADAWIQTETDAGHGRWELNDVAPNDVTPTWLLHTHAGAGCAGGPDSGGARPWW